VGIINAKYLKAIERLATSKNPAIKSAEKENKKKNAKEMGKTILKTVVMTSSAFSF
jgi:hypothetical protein